MDIAEFVAARLDEQEERLRRGWYSDTHWQVFETRVALGAWTVSRRRGVGTALSDEIALAGMNHLRELQDEWRRQEAVPLLADIAAKRAIVEDYVTTCRIRDEASARIREARASGRIVHGDYDEWERANREASILGGVVQQLVKPFAAHENYREDWTP